MCAQHRSECRRRKQPSPPRIRLAAVVEPFCCQKISVDETREDHACEKGSAEAGDPFARSAHEIGKLGCDRAGFGEGNPAPPSVMASWDLSALKATCAAAAGVEGFCSPYPGDRPFQKPRHPPRPGFVLARWLHPLPDQEHPFRPVLFADNRKRNDRSGCYSVLEAPKGLVGCVHQFRRPLLSGPGRPSLRAPLRGPPPDPTAPRPYEEPPRPIPIPRPDEPPVIDDPPPRRNA